MLEILSYDFFRNALIAGLLVSLISGTLGSLVVLRREPNITHSIANILFLWIVVSFFFSGNYYVYGIVSAALWVLLIYSLEKYTATSRESSKEILGQIGLAGWIFCVGFLWNIQLDIFNFLFGNILFVEMLNIYLLAWLLWAWIILFSLYGKKLIRSTLSPEITKSQWVRVDIVQLWYLLYLALFIALSLKIFWVLLLWAFLVLPGNIAKNIGRSFYGVCRISTLLSAISVFLWLYLSYFFDTSAGASIVLVLWALFFWSIFLKPHS